MSTETDYLISKTTASQRVGKATLKSVYVYSGSANAEVVIHAIGVDSTDDDLIVGVFAGQGKQVHFDGIEYELGFTVTPSQFVGNYVVEYEAK